MEICSGVSKNGGIIDPCLEPLDHKSVIVFPNRIFLLFRFLLKNHLESVTFTLTHYLKQSNTEQENNQL